MPTNEEGEFELVLGNRQLLSVFFIFVLLLGVFFMMGYILGRGSGPKEVAVARPPAPIDVTPSRDPSRPSPSATPVAPSAVPSRTEPVKTEPVKPEPVKPEPEPPKPEPKPEPKQEAKKGEPKKEAKKETAKKEPEPKPEPPRKPEPEKPVAPVKPSAGGAGTYLQVSATSKVDGAALVNKLAARGFAAITSPVPNSDLVRVLVGPVSDVADTRAKLRAAGYDSIVRKM